MINIDINVQERLTACEQTGANTVVHSGNTVDGKGEEEVRAGREGRQVPAPIGGELRKYNIYLCQGNKSINLLIESV